MWLENINKNIDYLTDLVKPENMVDVNKYAKDIRDKTILKTMFDFKKGVALLKYRYSKKITKPFKENYDEKKVDDYDKMITSYNDTISKNIENINLLFKPEMREEAQSILNDIIEETIIETIFEYQKGVDSLEGHISKNINF
jgi:replicative DNA helicase